MLSRMFYVLSVCFFAFFLRVFSFSFDCIVLCCVFVRRFYKKVGFVEIGRFYEGVDMPLTLPADTPEDSPLARAFRAQHGLFLAKPL